MGNSTGGLAWLQRDYLHHRDAPTLPSLSFSTPCEPVEVCRMPAGSIAFERMLFERNSYSLQPLAATRQPARLGRVTL